MGIPIGYGVVKTDTSRGDRQLARAHANLAICKRLTDALYDYLTEEARAHIEEVNHEKTQTVDTFTPSMEHLDQACKRRDYIQQQLDVMSEQADKLDKEMGTKAGGAVGMLRASMIMPLEMQLKDAEEWVSNIQRQMEAAAHAPQADS